MQEERFAFNVEWYDPMAALLRLYQLFYYPRDGSVEMFDVKNQRIFLRRTIYDDLHQEDLFVGNRVNVLSRQLNLTDYGDLYTANKLGSKKERTLALIKPDVATKIGDVLEMIYSNNLIVTKAKMTKLTWKEAAEFYVEHQSKPIFNNLVQFATSGPVVAMELMGDEAISTWRKLVGPTDPAVARREAPQSARAQFGTDGVKNIGHGSDSLAAAAKELEFFFPSTIGHGPSNTALCTDCTCCIIKPHAISEGLTGKILNSISAAGFEISALQMPDLIMEVSVTAANGDLSQSIRFATSDVMDILGRQHKNISIPFNVDRANAEEFYEIYKGVVTEYLSMVTQLCTGPCMVLEIRGTDAPQTFREFCGPADPEIARHLRPATLRALYGKDKVKNGVHCTDLPEDGVLEVQYFFKILDG